MRWAVSTLGLCAVLLAAPAIAQQPSRAIEVQELGAVDPFQVGSRNVLPQTIWSSSDADALRVVLEALPASNGQGWRHGGAARLAERVLLASGEPPRGGRDNFALAALRADRALAAGRVEQVYQLLERTPRLNQSSALSRLHAETAFALGETGPACNTAESLLRGRDEPYWLRARAVCLALAGNMPAAELTADLARSSEGGRSFGSWFDALVLDRGLPSAQPVSTGLELAIAITLAPEERIHVAENAPAWLKRAAARTGPAITLPEQLDEALEAAMAMEGADRAAALAAIAQQDIDRLIAAEALAARLDDAVNEGRFAEVARAYAMEIETFPINEQTLAHGPRFILALALEGELERAWRWREALLSGPERDRPMQEMNGQPGMLTPPPASFGFTDEDPWEPPSPAVMVALDMAIGIAADDIGSGPFGAILAARAEDARPERLAQLAGLAALGASVPEAVRVQLLETGSEEGSTGREAHFASMAALSLVNSSRAEVLLLAAGLIETSNGSAQAYALASYLLERAGHRAEALQLILEALAEESA
ncbi:flagellar hook-length control protein [Glycocaulis alkaliphilus]|uniref:Flagellar hook-length control protein n=1 Tax=Glycocaulis alkaliphilus TaxID=1434191 RepID=A0A3T0ED39_9PROT|nr:hypothetical protein [Glycocaulis alkaliphilus]AZU05201.1 flagellar hook-length control protein [Glycocaulis alkaliphilus]GGB64453.1 hypothetical protein GCM10007417_00170 [Glycocaulis alkaliphilus]